MIKCLFVDIKNIYSAISKSKFAKSEIDKLADSILETDGLIRPLIIQQTGLEQYIVIEGHLEYHAAVRAKEKDLRKAEMVNAFVIPPTSQQFAIEQLALLSKIKPSEIAIPTSIDPSIAEPDTKLFDRLVSQLSSEISQQLQPLQQQLDTVILELDRHKQILSALSSEPPIVTLPAATPSIEKVDRSGKTSTATTARKIANSKTEKKSAEFAAGQSQQLEPAVRSIDSQPPASTRKKATTAKKTIPATTPPKDRVKSDPFGAVEPEKLAIVLNLINTLNLGDLTLSMARSGIVSAETLAANIIAKRDTQPQQRFETWEAVILAKVPKLTTPKMAISIINKLK